MCGAHWRRFGWAWDSRSIAAFSLLNWFTGLGVGKLNEVPVIDHASTYACPDRAKRKSFIPDRWCESVGEIGIRTADDLVIGGIDHGSAIGAVAIQVLICGHTIFIQSGIFRCEENRQWITRADDAHSAGSIVAAGLCGNIFIVECFEHFILVAGKIEVDGNGPVLIAQDRSAGADLPSFVLYFAYIVDDLAGTCSHTCAYASGRRQLHERQQVFCFLHIVIE